MVNCWNYQELFIVQEHRNEYFLGEFIEMFQELYDDWK